MIYAIMAKRLAATSGIICRENEFAWSNQL